jgi:PhzF family phenazine biosynthesis protein
VTSFKPRAFKQVDVFTATPYLGNPLAVVLDGEGLSDAQMAAFARWTNLSETTFLLPPTQPEADYRVRIFTPTGELAFAGHPTLGSCYAWLECGGKPKSGEIIQECKVGLVRVKQVPFHTTSRSMSHLAFAAPPFKRSAASEAQLTQMAAALGIEASQIIASQLLDNGSLWCGLLLDSVDTVVGIKANYPDIKKIGIKIGVASKYTASLAAQLIAKSSREARAFAYSTQVVQDEEVQPDIEVRAFTKTGEDPVTGGLNASLAQWLIADGLIPEKYLASQGMCLDRAGRVRIERDASGQVWVGGSAVTCIDGMVKL